MSSENLSGVVYEQGCLRVGFRSKSVIVKKLREFREWLLYKNHSLLLKRLGVDIPFLYQAFQVKEEYWLVLEDILLKLPKNRWKADADILKVLFSLHYGTWKEKPAIPQPFIPQWSKSITDEAIAYFPSQESEQLRPILERIREQCVEIFEPLCLISGDPNPTNWGLRRDGSPVLFDWERVGFGHPAIDLAITIPGFGSPDGSTETMTAEKYLSFWSNLSFQLPFTLQELIKQMRLAKIWSAVEFLANHAAFLDQQTISSFTQSFPNILDSLE